MGPSKQELYNKAVAGIAAQGWERAGFWVETGPMTKSFRCRYKVEDKRCAIGHCLSEQDAETFDEIQAGANDVAREMGWESIPFFYGDLQNAHDGAKDEGSMKLRLKAVGQKYNLEIPDSLYEEPPKEAA